MPDIYLPNIIKLELTNFSLYCEQSVVMDFSKPVSCLMGANGIGKSTLLNCVNFAITGRINPTNKKLKSIDTLDRGNNYYLQYFDGRISEVDKDYASTRIVFMLGNKRIFLRQLQSKQRLSLNWQKLTITYRRLSTSLKN